MCRFHNMEYVEYLEQYVSKDIVAKYGSIGMGVNGEEELQEILEDPLIAFNILLIKIKDWSF